MLLEGEEAAHYAHSSPHPPNPHTPWHPGTTPRPWQHLYDAAQHGVVLSPAGVHVSGRGAPWQHVLLPQPADDCSSMRGQGIRVVAQQAISSALP